ATGEANAHLTAKTALSLDAFKLIGGLGGIAGALAVSDANTVSHVTIEKGASITAGTTVNVIATGNSTSDAEASSGLFANGTAGLAFALDFSNSDIKTSVDGTIISNADPVAGYTVKIEIDPLAGLNPDGTPQVGYVDYVLNRIYVGPNALVDEDMITYTNRRGTSISGLVDGKPYFIVTTDDPGWIQLAATQTKALRAIAGFQADNVVDLRTDIFPATDHNKLYFDSGNVDSAADTISLQRNGATVFNTFELGQAVIYKAAPGSSIGGLVDGNTYYVVASTNEQNLQGDSRFAETQVIRLAESENEARAGIGIDLGPATGNGFQLVAKHVLDSGFATGIGIVAQLKADNSASAEAGLQSESTGLYAELNENIPSNYFSGLFNIIGNEYNRNAKAPNAGASSSLSVAGALALTYATHDVRTDVLGDAVLKSNEDLEVKATIEQGTKLSAQSTTVPPTDPLGNPAETGNNASVAVSIGIIDNTAIATVHDGAQLDALRALRVISDVSYPIKTRFDQFIPLSWGELTDALRTDGASAITQYLNTNLGAVDAFFNTWTAAKAEAPEVGVAGSVSVLVYSNDSEAVVQGGALLNQDLAWRNDAVNPHPNQAGEAPDGKGEQVVSVEATNYQQTINMTGIFALPDLSLDAVPIIAPSPQQATLWDKYRLKKELSINPTGATGGSGGAGGAIFISVQNNTTHAIVDDGAKVYSGADGGFNMKAEEALLNVNLAQSFAKGETFAIGGTVLYSGQTSDTLARLGSTAVVTGREARIYAGDLTTTATWAGGIAKGESLGVGISVAVNDLHRQTRALIGNADAVSGTPIAGNTSIDVTDGVSTLAGVYGDLWAFTVAGAVASPDEPDDPTPAPAPRSPTAGAPSVPGNAIDEPKTGIGIAAAASVNLVDDTIQSSISDAGQVHAGFVAVDAQNDFGIVSASGGVAFAKIDSGSTAVGLAGAFSLNQIHTSTEASVQDTAFMLSGSATGAATSEDTLRVSAINDARIFSLAAGGAGAVAAGGSSSGSSGSTSGGDSSTAVAVAGSVTLNFISGDTLALFTHNTAMLTAGDALVQASNTASIIAAAGGLAFSFAQGEEGSSIAVAAGVAFAFNSISGDAQAVVDGSTLT
ncbi:MAG TPA: hypothetical protein VMW48_08300, partial [Vicinamibacterales bacterium]|nr:hypothetical protein [Vicinamibacterales bacterium]